jgi:hypothetical protein
MAAKKARFLNDKQKTLMRKFLANIITVHPSKNKVD